MNPETLKDETIVVLLFSVVKPLTFKVPNIEVLLFHVVFPLTFKDDINVILLMLNILIHLKMILM